MPLNQKEPLTLNRQRIKEPDSQGALKYQVERSYTGKYGFDEVVARICLVYMNQQRNLGK